MLTIATAATVKEAREKQGCAIGLMGDGFKMYLKGKSVVDIKDNEPVFPSHIGLEVHSIGRRYFEVLCDDELITVDPGAEFEVDFRV